MHSDQRAADDQRRQQLTELDIKIREAMLGEPEMRYDLLHLRWRVHQELRELIPNAERQE